MAQQDEQNITLNIAGASLQFKIERGNTGKEELYRLAEREVNRYFAELQTKNYKGWKEKEYLAFTALRFAINYLYQRQLREVSSDDLRTLEALSTEIDTYLNNPGQ